jgi:D-alanyl-D-alanine carboxypeptidase (penicillin-binding protein 5/6)
VRTARRGDRLVIRLQGAPTELDGPLPKGARVGTVLVTERGRVVNRVALETAEPVDAATFMDRLRDWLGRPITLLLLAAFAACSLCLVLLRRRAVRRHQARRSGRGAPVA